MLDSLLYLLTAPVICSVFVTHFAIIRHHQYDRENSSKSVYTFQFIPPDFLPISNFLPTFKDTTDTAGLHHSTVTSLERTVQSHQELSTRHMARTGQ